MIGPLAYVGGKRRLAPYIISLLPSHTTYVELFSGGAQVLFHKDPSRVEVLNDLDGEVVNFLRVCQRHAPELTRLLEYSVASRRMFEWHRDTDPRGLTDVERAARFYYLQNNAWGGRRSHGSFHRCVTKPPNFNPTTTEDRLARTAGRLARVQLECGPYEQVLDAFDRPTTLFYCDPPYVGVHLYEHNFSHTQFQDLSARLKAIRGKFLLSINDCPEVRQWFAGFECREVSVTYTAVTTPKRYPELLFANFPLPDP